MRAWVSNRLMALCLSVLVMSTGTASAADRKASVSLEVLTRPGLSLTASQKWYQALTNLGISGLQIRSGGARDEAAITEQGTAAVRQYKVVGILSADNVLYLPGAKFSLNDAGLLRKWLDNLRDQGPAGVTERPRAFGLLPKQLGEVSADLAAPVTFSTKDMPAADVVGQLAGQLKFPLLIDETGKRALAAANVSEELRGFSSGTALAIVLRPAGLVMVPERPEGGRLQYRVRRAQRGTESWPIGWKPQKRAAEVLPVLFEFLNVEITGIPVSDALAAIEGRLKAPLVYDHNAMALHGVDPAKVQAEVPGKRMSYSQTLRRVLSQAKLKYDLRVDEADKPFLWITTVKPAE